MYVCMNVCMYMYTYIYVYVNMITCMYVCMYACYQSAADIGESLFIHVNVIFFVLWEKRFIRSNTIHISIHTYIHK